MNFYASWKLRFALTEADLFQENATFSARCVANEDAGRSSFYTRGASKLNSEERAFVFLWLIQIPNHYGFATKVGFPNFCYRVFMYVCALLVRRAKHREIFKQNEKTKANEPNLSRNMSFSLGQRVYCTIAPAALMLKLREAYKGGLAVMLKLCMLNHGIFFIHPSDLYSWRVFESFGDLTRSTFRSDRSAEPETSKFGTRKILPALRFATRHRSLNYRSVKRNLIIFDLLQLATSQTPYCSVTLQK